MIKKVFLTGPERSGDEDERIEDESMLSPIDRLERAFGGEDGGESDVWPDLTSGSDSSTVGPIIRTGKAPFPKVLAIFSTEILLTPPKGTSCTLDGVERRQQSEEGHLRPGETMQDLSDALPNTIPFKYKPYSKLSSGITCVQRRVV